jgi:hypothetical protein
MYDIIFLSYDEPNAEFNYNKLKSKFGWAKRVNGVSGIYTAHQAAATSAKTQMFYVVDADADILPDFDFSFKPKREQREQTHLWYARNPVNGLEYGYGALKLFPRTKFINAAPCIDMTTSLNGELVVIEQCVSITRFNSSPLNAWRAAFRECTKLASSCIRKNNPVEDLHRLEIWCSQGTGNYADYCLKGAILGREFGLTNANNLVELAKINDWHWLKEQFNVNI